MTTTAQDDERRAKDAVVSAAIAWYESSHKDDPGHELAMSVLRYNKQRALLAAAQPVAQEAIPAGYEKMRGGKPVAFWRDDALEAAAGIVEAYQADPQIAIDIRRMKSAIKEWWRGVSPATGSES